MTLTAAIKFTQGPNTDSPGRAVFGTKTDGPVVCSDGGAGATSRVWTMFDVPPGSAVPTGVFSTSSTGTFPQPDADGGYLVLLTATDGIDTITTMLDFQIKEPSGRMIPPFKASDLALTFGGQTRGYSPTMEAWLRYVDSLKSVHNVRAATTAALPTHTFAGNVMTATVNAVLASQDGVALALGDRLLVKDEGAGSSLQNGVYTLTALGSGGAPWSLTRAIDFNTDFSVKAGYFGVVEEGTANGKRGFVLSTPNPIVLNTTLLAFQTFAFSALTPPSTPTQDGFSVRASGGNLQYFGGTNGQAVVWVGGQATFGSVSLAAGSAGISGVLTAANGGTGLSTVGGANTVPISNGTTLAYGLIADANVAGGAAIAVTKLALGAANRVLLSDGTANQFGQVTDSFISASAAVAVTKLAAGAANTVLQSNGTTNSFAQIADAQIAASAAVAVTKIAAGAANTVLQSNGTTNSFAQVTNAHVSAAAGIVLSKLGQSGATTGQLALWNGSTWIPGMAAQFGATFYIDPTFAGTSNGTPSAPYPSYATAIAAAPSSGALLIQAPFTNTVENVTFPALGNWEAKCDSVGRATITGNIICSSPVQAFYRFTNLTITGNTSGLASNPTPNASNFLVLTNSQVLGTTTMTASASGFWFTILRGAPTNFFATGGFTGGAVNIAGQLFASNWNFGGPVTVSSVSGADNCRFNGGSDLITTTLGFTITNSSFGASPQFVGGLFALDGFTYVRAGGFSLSGGATTSLFSAVDPSKITQGGAATTNVLAWNGTIWAPAAAGAALTSSAPADVTFSAAVVGVGTTAARSDHKHNITVATAVSVGTTNAQGSASTLALSDHTHAVTGLLITSQAQGDVLFFNGTSWVRLAPGTSGLFLKTQGAAANPVWSTITIAALSPGATGQALITTGGVPAWGNDFAAQDLTTTGSLLGLAAVQFGATQATPSLKQANTAVAAATGQTLTVQAQTASGTGATVGGKLVLASGAGLTAGALELRSSGNLLFDYGTTAASTITLGSTIFPLSLKSNSPATLNAGGGVYLFKAAELALSTNINLLSFGDTSGPTIKPLDNATAGWVGGLFTVQGQNSTGTGATVGGKLLFASGTGATDGDLELMQGATSVVKFAPTTGAIGASGKVLTVNSANGAAFKTAGATQLTLVGGGVVDFAQGALLTTVDNAANNTTGTAWTVRGQNSTGTTSVGGDLVVAAGTGTMRGGNVALHAAAASNQGMAGGVFLGKVGTLPSGDPTNGLYLWSSAAGELTTRSTTPLGGTIPVMRLGDGTTQMTYNCETASGIGGHDFQLGGITAMSVGLSGTLLKGNVVISGTDPTLGLPNTAATSGTFNTFSLLGQTGLSSSGTYTGGSVAVIAGDTFFGGTGTHTGGDVLIRGGRGGAAVNNGNIALGTTATPNWQGGAGIVFIANNTALPTGNPSGGGFLFPDAGALKWRGSSGTITTIAPA